MGEVRGKEEEEQVRAGTFSLEKAKSQSLMVSCRS